MGFNELNGFLNIMKEAGWTSMDVCARLRKILGARKVGHAGTLDPMAEGVLPVAIGRATKDIPLTKDYQKTYLATLRLGITTETEDITGKVLSTYPGDISLTEGEITEALMSFVGGYYQLTPRYSARKYKGKPLYKYARAGIEVERKEKLVSICSIEIRKIELPTVEFLVVCSAGTYIRTLSADVGERLGVGACLAGLKRLRAGEFDISESLTVSEVEELFSRGRIGSALRVLSPTAVAIGKFDGAHLGHQALLSALKNLAREENLKTLVIVLRGTPGTVMPDSERRKKIYGLGIDYCIELELDEKLMNIRALDFLKMMRSRYHMRALAAGDDLSFGKDREGNVKFLIEHAPALGIRTLIIDKVRAEDVSGGEAPVISSTLIRKELSLGQVEEAARHLGKPYTLSGVVIRGRHLGTESLELPTLNIDIPEKLVLPPKGVYAARFRIYAPPGSEGARDGGKKKLLYEGSGIGNLGTAPTVDENSEGKLRFEIHAFADLPECYGMYLEAELWKFLRPERAFGSVEELKAEILSHDIPMAEEALAIRRSMC